MTDPIDVRFQNIIAAKRAADQAVEDALTPEQRAAREAEERARREAEIAADARAPAVAMLRAAAMEANGRLVGSGIQIKKPGGPAKDRDVGACVLSAPGSGANPYHVSFEVGGDMVVLRPYSAPGPDGFLTPHFSEFRRIAWDAATPQDFLDVVIAWLEAELAASAS